MVKKIALLMATSLMNSSRLYKRDFVCSSSAGVLRTSVMILKNNHRIFLWTRCVFWYVYPSLYMHMDSRTSSVKIIVLRILYFNESWDCYQKSKSTYIFSQEDSTSKTEIKRPYSHKLFKYF
jgi:hypothetical protein